MPVMQKINVLLYGNCQIKLIAKILKELHSDILNITHLTQVQMIDEPDLYFKSMESEIINAEIIITQNIKAPAKDPFLKLLAITGAKRILFIDSLYVSYYHPELVATKIIPKFESGLLHDKNIIKAIVEGVSLENFLLNDPFYDSSFYNNNIYEKSISQSMIGFESRKKELDKKIKSFSSNIDKNIEIEHISIIPFINETCYKVDLSLWADHNHPNLPVFKWLYKQITNKTDIISKSKFDNIFDYLTFQSYSRPVYASTIKHMKLSNQDNLLYKIGLKYTNKTRKEYVKDAWNFYLSIDQSKIKNFNQELK